MDARRELAPRPGRTAETRRLESDLAIRLVTPPLFLATKLEAVRGRGQGDLFGSRDVEDVVAVVDGRGELVAEVAASDPEVRAFLADAVGALLDRRDFRPAIEAHLGFEATAHARAGIVWERLEAMRRASSG